MTISKEMIRYAGGAELVPARAVQHAPDELDLRSLWGALWRRKLLLIATVGIITGAAVAYVQTATPLYRGQALVRIQPGKEMVVDLPDVTERFEANGANIESEVELLRSRAFAERMVERLGLAQDPEFNAALRPEPQGLVADARRRVEILRLRFGENLPVRDIADRLEMDRDLCHAELRKARAEFQRALREEVLYHNPQGADSVDAGCLKLLELLR